MSKRPIFPPVLPVKGPRTEIKADPWEFITSGGGGGGFAPPVAAGSAPLIRSISIPTGI